MPASRTPADTQSRPHDGQKQSNDKQQLDVRRDVLMPDLRARAEREGRDPNEVDPMSDDEDTLRLTSLGGSAALD